MTAIALLDTDMSSLVLFSKPAQTGITVVPRGQETRHAVRSL